MVNGKTVRDAWHLSFDSGWSDILLNILDILKKKNGFPHTEEGLYTQNVCFLKPFDTFWYTFFGEYHFISYLLVTCLYGLSYDDRRLCAFMTCSIRTVSIYTSKQLCTTRKYPPPPTNRGHFCFRPHSLDSCHTPTPWNFTQTQSSKSLSIFTYHHTSTCDFCFGCFAYKHGYNEANNKRKPSRDPPL